MANPIFLTPADVATLKGVVERVNRLPGNTTGRPFSEEEQGQAPDVYIAFTPTGGIPGMVIDLNTGTGTPLGTGTEFGAGNTPGYADCPIYRITETQGIPDLELVYGLTRRVYNLSRGAIKGSRWLPIMRDKFGSWIAMRGGGFSGSKERIIDVYCSGNDIVVVTAYEYYEDGRLLAGAEG